MVWRAIDLDDGDQVLHAMTELAGNGAQRVRCLCLDRATARPSGRTRRKRCADVCLRLPYPWKFPLLRGAVQSDVQKCPHKNRLDLTGLIQALLTAARLPS